jgi:hypothetical protein
MADEDTENEIRQIEHDLENLHRRYVALDRSAHRIKVSFYVFLAGLVVLAGAAAGAATGNLMVLVSSTAFLMFACAFAYASRHERWIDFASGPWGWIGLAVRRVEAQAVEDMVTECMARLAELKGDPK